MELIKIGKVGKTHGFRGHLKMHIDEFYMDDFENMQAIFINNLPHFIISKDINSGDQAIVLLEEIDNKEKAQRFQGKDIFAKDDDLMEILDGDEYGHLTGFEMHDKKLGKIGIIEEIIEMPFQFLAKIKKNDKDLLIPLNEDFIILIKEEQKCIEMQLPEGLLDVF
jgi:16S rRNA processing protein RimM